MSITDSKAHVLSVTIYQLSMASVMLCDARQATVKPQWHATISAHCSPFWGQLGVSQLLLLFLAGLTPLFSHLLTIG